MIKIKKIHAREILDSRGNPTIEVEVTSSNDTVGRAAVPSGASTGAHEAHELRDKDTKRYLGKGVLKAVENVNSKIASALVGQQYTQQELDKTLISLDGTKTKSNLGANALLGVSLAYARASAAEKKVSLFKHLNGDKATHLPVPLMNILNGGAHADNGLDVQEFMIAPVCGGSFKEALRAGSEVFHTLKKILNDKGLATGVGDEGGFAPKLQNNKHALELISQAVEKAGYKLGKDIYLALDVAATELYSDGKYRWEGKVQTPEDQMNVYKKWSQEFPIISIEDGFSEDDWSTWSAFTKEMGSKLQLVGDDLFVTNPERITQGIEKRSANALLVKPNQIGTLTETKAAIDLARSAGFKTVILLMW
jgi:enolase